MIHERSLAITKGCDYMEDKRINLAQYVCDEFEKFAERYVKGKHPKRDKELIKATVAVFESNMFCIKHEWQEWIPVSKQRPEDLRGVLVYCSTSKNIYCAYFSEGDWFTLGTHIFKIEDRVTHWMPLPQDATKKIAE